MRDTEAWLAEVLELPEPARAELAARILESLDGPPDTDVDGAWALEIERLAAAIDNGEVVTLEWDVLYRRVERDIFDR